MSENDISGPTPQEIESFKKEYVKKLIWIAFYLFSVSVLVAAIFKTFSLYGIHSAIAIGGMGLGLIIFIHAVIYAFMEGIID